MLFDRIVFPVDFSEPNRRLAPFVRAVAARFQSEVLMLHVLVPPNFYAPPGELPVAAFDTWEEIRSIRKQTLDEFLRDELAGISVRRAFREGDPARETVSAAESEQAALIMMPTHGYGPFRAFLVGSVTAKVLHDAHCPVWTAAHTAEASPHPAELWRRILCAVDSTGDAARCVAWASDLARAVTGEVRVLHAVEGLSPETRDSESRLAESLVESAGENLAKVLEPAVAAQVVYEFGSAGEAVRRAAADWDAQLVVIGRGKARKPLGGLRSKAYAIIRQSPCPVMSV